MIYKEILNMKEDINEMRQENDFLEKRRAKLQKHTNDEHHLVDTLNKLVVKLKKEITDTNKVKDIL